LVTIVTSCDERSSYLVTFMNFLYSQSPSLRQQLRLTPPCEEMCDFPGSPTSDVLSDRFELLSKFSYSASFSVVWISFEEPPNRNDGTSETG
jgi:hypothetical protein